MTNTQESIRSHQDHCNEVRAKLKDLDLLGPWIDEPDRIEFKSHGLDCLLQRNPQMFQWCGYVGVDLDHPNVKKLDEDDNLEVHGGITYRSECEGSICHLTEKEDNLFWLGFDCAHFQDFVPGMELNMIKVREITPKLHEAFPEMKKIKDDLALSAFNSGSHYRDMNYVIEQTKDLARQLSSKVKRPRKRGRHISG